MSLSAFIRDQQEQIIVEFAAFAKTLMPAGSDMSDEELRDHAKDMLTAVLVDIGTPQTEQEQSRKSKGRGNGGAAIPPNAMPSIFEPLTRGAADGGAHSIGLGLFIARAIVSAHGGDISVTSSTDHGTTFTARLPK